MKLQTRLAVLVCKASGAVLRRLGRGGTNLPGKLALKIDKNILGELSRGVKVTVVTGTNGKGSTCAYLASILQAAGLRTGLFTSPYLITFEERIRVDGVNIALDQLAEVALLVKEQAEAMTDHPTEFELMTAVALELTRFN